MDSKSLRQKFLDYYKEKGHSVLPSSSLVPDETDPSVLFNTAGMQQFKRFYSEPDEAPAASIATCQKCIRTGDIDEVGDNTHLTFFEMLGNFSFGYPQKEGSYFKKEAIAYAWEFLTEVLKVDKKRIHATYFQGERGVTEDNESKKILESIDGLCKVIPQGFDDNFWSLGTENSPGGPTVEFYIDGIEIWNLVFNEFVLKSGVYTSSKTKGVDTGMGLERLTTMLQEKRSVYDTELFQPIITFLEKWTHKKYADNLKDFRIISDHVKAAAFMICEGIQPSNKGIGYVLRRILRRAVSKGYKLGIYDEHEFFTPNIMGICSQIYSDVYDLQLQKFPYFNEIAVEENSLVSTYKQLISDLSKINSISGKVMFNWFQSKGLPLEIILEGAVSNNIVITDTAINEFNDLYKKHQDLSRTASAGMFKGGLAEAGEITTKYHTATHLLLAALRQILGDKVFQKGSNITPERLRFDFSYPDKMTPEQVKEVEDIVNDKIKADLPVSMEEMTLEDAKACGAMGVFESKYGEKVKVYSIGDFSNEICGGPHVSHTGVLGHFEIAKEESSSAGVRRIKAILK